MASVAKRRWTLPDGSIGEKWVVRYKDDGGVHRQRTFSKKKEADAFRIKAEGELQAGVHVARGASVTVNQLLDRYLEHIDERARDGRRMSYAHQQSNHRMFRCHVRPYIGAISLADLTFERTEQWARDLGANSDLSLRSIKRVLNLFKVALDYATRRQWMHRANVAALVLQEYRGVAQAPIRTFSEEQVQRLFATALIRPPSYTERSAAYLRCFIYLAALCGLRRGEIEGLTIGMIDFERAVISIRHSLTDDDTLKGPKTKAGVRDIPMPRPVAIELKTWLTTHYVTEERNLLFRTSTGKMIGPQNFHTNYWRRILDRAGLGPDEAGRRFNFHALRHFCASCWVQHMPLPDVAEMLGHSSFDMTLQVYTHALVRGNRRSEAIEALAESFATNGSPTPNLRLVA